MKTLKLHATASGTFRVLLDGQVHPLLVGFHSVFDAAIKLATIGDQFAPFDEDSLYEFYLEVCAQDRDDKEKAGQAITTMVAFAMRNGGSVDPRYVAQRFEIPPGKTWSQVMKERAEGGFKPEELIVHAAVTHSSKSQITAGEFADEPIDKIQPET